MSMVFPFPVPIVFPGQLTTTMEQSCPDCWSIFSKTWRCNEARSIWAATGRLSLRMFWTGPMRILRPPFLRAPDRAHGGWKPLRTYTGPRYNGGLSDHCPIQVDLYL